MTVPLPSPFIVDWVPRVATRVPRGSWALDLATGSGRHLPIQVQTGLRTVAVDRSFESLVRALSPPASGGVMA
ncbi:MAG: hypothetical protein AB7N65_20075, partial [Vicinamibacterales bacterium]